MKLVIFGANGPAGKVLSNLALNAGHSVSAVTRHPDTFPIQHERLAVLRGDVFEPTEVVRAIEGHDAVLSLFGIILKRIVGRTLYADMRRMEELVMRSDLADFMIREAQNSLFLRRGVAIATSK